MKEEITGIDKDSLAKTINNAVKKLQEEIINDKEFQTFPEEKKIWIAQSVHDCTSIMTALANIVPQLELPLYITFLAEIILCLTDGPGAVRESNFRNRMVRELTNSGALDQIAAQIEKRENIDSGKAKLQ